MNPSIPDEIATFAKALEGLPCWYVSAGSGVGSSFDLILGEKIERPVPLTNTAVDEEFRHFEGEASLLVWCSWRLDGMDEPIASSDESSEAVLESLQILLGQHIQSVYVFSPAWDLEIVFSGPFRLKVLCDHIPDNPSFDGNWDLGLNDQLLSAGPGYDWSIEKRLI